MFIFGGFSHFARMSHFFGGVSFLPATTLHHPVGGFNQSEKYQSSWIIPQMGIKIKKNVSNHHPDIFSSQETRSIGTTESVHQHSAPFSSI